MKKITQDQYQKALEIKDLYEKSCSKFSESLLTAQERLHLYKESLEKNQRDEVLTDLKPVEFSIYAHAFQIAINSLLIYFPKLKEDDTKTT